MKFTKLPVVLTLHFPLVNVSEETAMVIGDVVMLTPPMLASPEPYVTVFVTVIVCIFSNIFSDKLAAEYE